MSGIVTRKVKQKNELLLHSNFSFNIIEHEIWLDSDLSNSLFNGASFSDCEFKNINFSNADFEGTKFYKCEFSNCSFVGSEIHSVWFSECLFSVLQFNNSVITDSTFYSCKFLSCSYEGFVLTQSYFKNCFINSFSSRGCSITLNQFIETTFTNAGFLNVFYYQIFQKCKFYDSTFEAYLLGYVYGLTEKNLLELNCTLMGKEFPNTLIESRNFILDIYNERQMFLNIGFLQLGINEKQTDILLVACVEFLKKFFEAGQILKNDQVTFLKQIIEFLYNKGKLAPISLFLIENILSHIINRYNKISNVVWEKSAPYIRELRNTVYFMTLNFLDSINSIDAYNSNGRVVLKIWYYEKPAKPFVEIMKLLSPESPEPILLKTQNGSFIEWISCQENIIICIRIFLQLIGAVAVPFIINAKNNKKKDGAQKKQSEIEARNSKKTEYVKVEVSTPEFIVKSEYGREFMKSFSTFPTEENIKKVNLAISVILESKIMNDEKKQGYTNDNIKEIEIIYDFSKDKVQ